MRLIESMLGGTRVSISDLTIHYMDAAAASDSDSDAACDDLAASRMGELSDADDDMDAEDDEEFLIDLTLRVPSIVCSAATPASTPHSSPAPAASSSNTAAPAPTATAAQSSDGQAGCMISRVLAFPDGLRLDCAAQREPVLVVPPAAPGGHG